MNTHSRSPFRAVLLSLQWFIGNPNTEIRSTGKKSNRANDVKTGAQTGRTPRSHLKAKFDWNFVCFQLDAKASPLALLAKTCSQIGADPSFPNGAALGKASGLAKKLDGATKESKSVSPYGPLRSESREPYDSRSRSGSVEIKVTDQLAQRDETKTRSSLSSNVSSMSAKSPHPVVTLLSENEDNPDDEEPERKRAKTATPQRTSNVTPVTASDTKSNQKVSASHQSPIVRTSLDASSGNGSLGSSGTGSNTPRDLLLANYRPPFPPSLSYPGFPGSSGTYASPLSTNPFWASFMSSTAGLCRDPLCADPFCPTSLRNQQLIAAATGRMSASSALSNYSTLLNAAAAAQHREALLAAQRSVAMAAAASATASAPSGPSSGMKPYVCSWVAGM